MKTMVLDIGGTAIKSAVAENGVHILAQAEGNVILSA